MPRLLRRVAMLALILPSALVPAVGSARLVAFPLGLRLNVPAGEEAIASVQVYNPGPRPQTVTLRLMDWFRTPEGVHYYPPGSLDRSLAPWLSLLEPARFTLAPAERRDVRLLLTVPPAAEGSHWTMLLVEGDAQAQAEASTEAITATAQVTSGYAIALIQTDPTTAAPAGNLLELKVLGHEPFGVQFLFENAGNVHLLVRGWTEVRNTAGQVLKHLELPPFGVLPGETRVRRVQERPPISPLPAGDYLALVVLDFGGSFLIAGQRSFHVP